MDHQAESVTLQSGDKVPDKILSPFLAADALKKSTRGCSFANGRVTAKSNGSF
jgi:hypothetical protein